MKITKYVLLATILFAAQIHAAPVEVGAAASAARADRLDDDDDGPSDPKRFKVRPTPGPVPGKADFQRKQKRIVDVCEVAKPAPSHCKK